MSLDSLLASLESDGTSGTSGTTSNGAAFGCAATKSASGTNGTLSSEGGKFVPPVPPCFGNGGTPKPAWIKAVPPVPPVPLENGNVPQTTQNRDAGTTADNSDPAAKARRRRVLAILAEHPNVRRAVVVAVADTDPVLLTVGIRDVATFDLACPAATFDAFALLALIGRHGETVH